MAVSRATLYKYEPSNFQNPKRKTDMCEICVKYEKRKHLYFSPSGELNINFEKEYKVYQLHKKFADHQKNAYQHCESNLESDECIVIADFKQNIEIGSTPEGKNKEFYNKQPISVLGFGVIYLGSTGRKIVYFDYLQY